MLSLFTIGNDMIWNTPGEKHWHGATVTTAMTVIAIQEHLDGNNADWVEKVSDEQYKGKIKDDKDNGDKTFTVGL